MRFVLFADLHLDAPFAWAGREGARRRRQAIRDTLDNVLALAAEVKPDAILCAGDLYEQDRLTPDTRAFLQSRFAGTDTPIFVAPGNHDPHEPRSLYALANWSSNVTIFQKEALTPVELAEGLRLWGAAHRKPAGTDGFLGSGFSTGGGAFDLALFHGSEESGLPFENDAKSPHAPFAASEIEKAGLQHALVGHFHTPAEGDWHTYPGNPQPLTFGESGPRGAVIVEIDQKGELTRTWHQVEASPSHDLKLDISKAASSQDVREAVASALTNIEGVARLALAGDVPAEIELDSRSLGEVPHQLEAPPVFDTSAVRATYDFEAISTEQTVRGQFVRDVQESTDFPDETERRRVLVTGLRALDGRDDLEVPG